MNNFKDKINEYKEWYKDHYDSYPSEALIEKFIKANKLDISKFQEEDKNVNDKIKNSDNNLNDDIKNI